MPKKKPKIAYQEFGQRTDDPALQRATADLAPEKQQIRVQATKAGRKGKIVTVIMGFQHSSQTLTKLLKTLKSQCGSGGTLKDNNLEIQGDHRQKLVSILREMGYNVKISGG